MQLGLPREALPSNGLKRPKRGLEQERKGEGARILSEQLNDYREICCRSAAIPKDGRVSTLPCELFNSFWSEILSIPPSPVCVISFCSTGDDTLLLFIRFDETECHERIIGAKGKLKRNGTKEISSPLINAIVSLPEMDIIFMITVFASRTNLSGST